MFKSILKAIGLHLEDSLKPNGSTESEAMWARIPDDNFVHADQVVSMDQAPIKMVSEM